MKERTISALATIGLLAPIPAVYFVFGNVAKYSLEWTPGLPVPALHPAVVLGALAAAVFANALLVFRVRREPDGIAIVARWRPLQLGVLALTAMTASVLFAYLVVENAVPHV